jgi:hypothetical protein
VSEIFELLQVTPFIYGLRNDAVSASFQVLIAIAEGLRFKVFANLRFDLR